MKSKSFLEAQEIISSILNDFETVKLGETVKDLIERIKRKAPHLEESLIIEVLEESRKGGK